MRPTRSRSPTASRPRTPSRSFARRCRRSKERSSGNRNAAGFRKAATSTSRVGTTCRAPRATPRRGAGPSHSGPFPAPSRSRKRRTKPCPAAACDATRGDDPMISRSRLATLSLVTALAACSQPPERIETLEQARTAVQAIEQEPLARDVAQTRYEAARSALSRAEQAYDENEDTEIIEHEAYTALRNAQIVQAQVDERRSRDELENSEAERNRVLLEAREREAARASELAAERGQALAAREQELELTARQAEEAEQRAQQLAEQAQSLEQQLTELEAEQTQHGWVLTLSDVLFDFDRAELNPGAATTLDRLARFLEENPDRKIA